MWNSPAAVTMATLFQLEALFHEPGMRSTRRRLKEKPFAIPGTLAERRSLLEFADRMVMVGIAVRVGAIPPDIVVEKYGNDVQALLANPFVQDQALQHPLEWESVVGCLGRAVLKYGSELQSNHEAVPEETRRFVLAYDKDALECKKHTFSEVPVPFTDYYVKCDSTRQLLLRRI
jgi:hypothetical protein